MRTLTGILTLGLISAIQFSAYAQHATTPRPYKLLVAPPSQTSSQQLAELAALDEQEENKRDPAYSAYKEGYNAILDERWPDAVKKLAEVKAKYPNSEYLDDAEYWTAYALSHTDRNKGIVAYERFIKKYPKSRYVDDAVADLGGLPSVVVGTPSPDGDSTYIVVSSAPGVSAHSYGTSVKLAESQIRRSEAMTRQLSRELARSFAPRALRPPRTPHMLTLPPSAVWEVDRETKLDPDTRVRLEALYAIGDTKEDETAFQTLKDVAFDQDQNIRLRQAAIEVLADFKKYDVLPVFLELARKDSDQRIQDAAIEFVGRSGKDKNKAVEALVTLFNSMPQGRKKNLETVLFTIADVGNDKAVDFLSTVARTNANYELRTDAVYYLGTIGGEKARTALYQILKSK